MKLPHFTQHGTQTSGDALDLFVEETSLLRKLFAKWETTTPETTMKDETVTAKWDHGTIGKLLLEHAAVRLAASEEIVRVLQELGRSRGSSELLDESNHLVRPVLDEMYDSGRGVQPISVAVTPAFVEAVQQLQELLRAQLGGSAETHMRVVLTSALGSERVRLRSAKFIRKHSPAHPGPERRWYDRVPIFLRVHAAEDRLRGFPWGESSLGDRELAKRYDREI